MARSITLKALKETAKQVNQDSRLRKLGSCDAVMGIKVASRCFAVTFAGFEVAEVAEIDADALLDVDFYIDMKKKQWETFLAGLEGDTPRTLNELDLDDAVVKGADERKRLTFFRYHRSFQHFFEVAAAA
jgi:hypothetical protein